MDFRKNQIYIRCNSRFNKPQSFGFLSVAFFKILSQQSGVIYTKRINIQTISQILEHKHRKKIYGKFQLMAKNIEQQFEILTNFENQLKKIDKFRQGYNLQIQDFYAMKQGYRNTLGLVYGDIQKKIGNQNLKCQLKLRILCCHSVNRVFGKTLKGDIFPNFNTWVKNTLKGTQLKKQREFTRLNEWLQLQSPEKLAKEIENIKKKFYT